MTSYVYADTSALAKRFWMESGTDLILSVDVLFLAFDRELLAAARSEGLETAPEVPGAN